MEKRKTTGPTKDYKVESVAGQMHVLVSVQWCLSTSVIPQDNDFYLISNEKD